jgi:flagellar motility protein MotE (MotC chaperone)
MAKKEKEEKEGGKFLSFIIIFLIIVVWLAAMVILIKLDVGHFGSQVLRPVLKDVPVVNMILPAASDDEAIAESEYPYDNLADALARIAELESINSSNEALIEKQNEEISEKDNEIARLKVFENDQEAFTQLKNEFYDEVVFGNSAPDADTYIEWYESIDSEAAEEIYRQVVAEKEASDDIKSLATAYADMDAKDAAEILETMSGDLDIVVKIMDNMSSSDQAEILAEMDPQFAANVTKKLMP